MKIERTCRVCGCTQYNACLTIHGGCYWVEEDLCSECVGKESEDRGMRKIAYHLSKKKLVVVEVKKGEFFDLTSLDSINVTINNSLIKITTDNRTKNVLKVIQDELKRHVRVLFNKKRAYIGLIPDDFDFKLLEKKYKTEV